MSDGRRCHYCGEGGDLRPYGPGGSYVCYPCGTSPEHLEETDRNFNALIDAAIELSPHHSITIGTEEGPQPL